MQIPPEIIDKIKQAVDIVDIIGSYITLKKKGANYLRAACLGTSEAPDEEPPGGDRPSERERRETPPPDPPEL